MVAVAGPNGAGKSTFYDAFLAATALYYINADVLSLSLGLEPYRAAELADRLRRELVARRESFIFETVFSDPSGDKLQFMKETGAAGYTVLLIFIGIDDSETSDTRVAMRVAGGGHDVPSEKIRGRFPRIMRNLERALMELENVHVYDNSRLANPYRLIVVKESGRNIEIREPVPGWLRPLLPK
jgi:predicted ABC-type ATPase